MLFQLASPPSRSELFCGVLGLYVCDTYLDALGLAVHIGNMALFEASALRLLEIVGDYGLHGQGEAARDESRGTHAEGRVDVCEKMRTRRKEARLMLDFLVLQL